MASFTLRLAPAALPVTGTALAVGAGRTMYATVEDGVVTAVTYGVLPANTDTVLYVDLQGLPADEWPAAGWYYAHVCQSFSILPPVIPAGDVAPPYTPGLPPPVPGDPDYPELELPEVDDRPPLANTSPVWVSFHADGAASLSASGTAGYEEVDPRMRTLVRLTDVCAVRLQAHVVTGGSGALFLCYYDEDIAEWVPLSKGDTGPNVPIAAAGTYAGLFLNPKPELEGDVLLNVCTFGTAAGTVGNVLACFFVKTGPGACVDIGEDPECGLSVDAFTYGEDWQDYASRAAWLSFLSANLASQFLFDNVFTSFSNTYGRSAAMDTSVALPGAVQSLRGIYWREPDPPFIDNLWGVRGLLRPQGAGDTELVYQWTGRFDPAFNAALNFTVAINPSGTSGDGLWVLTIDDRGTDNSRQQWVVVQRADHLQLLYSSSGSSPYTVVTTISSTHAATYGGEDIQVTLCGRYSGGNAEVEVYVDPACTSPPANLVATDTRTRRTSGSTWTQGQWMTPNFDPPDTETSIWHHKLERGTRSDFNL